MVLRMLWYTFKSSMEMWQHFKDFSISWSNVRQWELAVNIIPWIHLKWYAWSWQNSHCISKIDGIDRLLRRREPTLIDLANFAEDEITLVNDPLYSRQAVSQYLEKGPTRQSQRGGRKNSIQWPPKQTIHQKVYKREKNKQWKDMSSVLWKAWYWRLQVLHATQIRGKKQADTSEKVLLWLLQEIKKDQDAMNCIKRRFCKVCNGKYSITLHGYVRKKIEHI